MKYTAIVVYVKQSQPMVVRIIDRYKGPKQQLHIQDGADKCHMMLL